MPRRQHRQQRLAGLIRRPDQLSSTGNRIKADLNASSRNAAICGPEATRAAPSPPAEARVRADAAEHQVRRGDRADRQLTDLAATRPLRRAPAPSAPTGRAPRAETPARVVGLRPGAVRLNSVTPELPPHLRICWLRGGCAMCRRAAARLKCSSSATAAKWRKVTQLHHRPLIPMTSQSCEKNILD